MQQQAMEVFLERETLQTLQINSIKLNTQTILQENLYQM
jgi:hypothetical protein